MKTIILDRKDWDKELAKLWKLLDGREVEVEVQAPTLGDQIEAEHVPLKGLSYDPKNNMVQIWVGDIDHMIHKPQKIMVVYDADERFIAIDITDKDGEQHIITTKEPVSIAT